ncbi:MAG TPA: hypothetical protein VKY56_11505 [Chloroflexota bacterium]|nr:hypothetical protein [Chloroflexota bacterium]
MSKLSRDILVILLMGLALLWAVLAVAVLLLPAALLLAIHRLGCVLLAPGRSAEARDLLDELSAPGALLP